MLRMHRAEEWHDSMWDSVFSKWKSACDARDSVIFVRYVYSGIWKRVKVDFGVFT